MGPILLVPKSRGYLALRSRDFLQPPLIQPDYLNHDDDLELLIEGVKFTRRLAHAHVFDPYGSEESFCSHAAHARTAIVGTWLTCVKHLFIQRSAFAIGRLSFNTAFPCSC
jgi:choline dehydrogenase-like flavoprotein